MSKTENRIQNATSKKELTAILTEVKNYDGFIVGNKLNQRVQRAAANRTAQLNKKARKPKNTLTVA